MERGDPSRLLLGLPGGDVQRRPGGWHVHGEHVHPQFQAALGKRGMAVSPTDLFLCPTVPIPHPFRSIASKFSSMEARNPPAFPTANH